MGVYTVVTLPRVAETTFPLEMFTALIASVFSRNLLFNVACYTHLGNDVFLVYLRQFHVLLHVLSYDQRIDNKSIFYKCVCMVIKISSVSLVPIFLPLEKENEKELVLDHTENRTRTSAVL
jgi:hypothetical protein